MSSQVHYQNYKVRLKLVNRLFDNTTMHSGLMLPRLELPSEIVNGSSSLLCSTEMDVRDMMTVERLG